MAATLTYYVDFKSPYAYLSVAPTRAMTAQANVELDWLPLTLDIPSFLGSARVDESGRVLESDRTPRQWQRVRYAYMDARRYASLRGLVLRGPLKIWDSSLAAIGLLFAKRQSGAVLDRYVDSTFERFWKRELDIEDPGVVEAQLRDAGARVEGFRAFLAGDGRAEHDRIQAVASEKGVFGVPTYVVGDEVFWGRENLALVRHRLTGLPLPDPFDTLAR
jgi:2-hydroxychromene-2-carboxylate isomerase